MPHQKAPIRDVRGKALATQGYSRTVLVVTASCLPLCFSNRRHLADFAGSTFHRLTEGQPSVIHGIRGLGRGAQYTCEVRADAKATTSGPPCPPQPGQHT